MSSGPNTWPISGPPVAPSIVWTDLPGGVGPPATPAAVSQAELAAQINILEQQLATLKAQLAKITP